MNKEVEVVSSSLPELIIERYIDQYPPLIPLYGTRVYDGGNGMEIWFIVDDSESWPTAVAAICSGHCDFLRDGRIIGHVNNALTLCRVYDLETRMSVISKMQALSVMLGYPMLSD